MNASPAPIRLRISYSRPEVLLGELTRSLGKGRVALKSPRAVPVGTRFVLELRSAGVSPVEVLGSVERVLPLGKEFLVSVRYDPSRERGGLDEVLAALEKAHQQEKARKFVRIPLNLPAQSELPYSPSFLIKDLSRGGMGVGVELPKLPPEIQVGTFALADLTLRPERLLLYGEITWTLSTPQGLGTPSFGIRFGKLRPDTLAAMERILHLRALPPPPWKALIAFGDEAMARLPAWG